MKTEIEVLRRIREEAEQLVGSIGNPAAPNGEGKIPLDAQRVLSLRTLLREYGIYRTWV